MPMPSSLSLIVAKPQPPEQLRKSLPAEAEIGRGPAAVTAGPGQGGPDEPLLEASPRVLQPGGANRGRPSDGGGQQRGAHPPALRRADGERRHHILQLPNITRPVVPRQRREGGGVERGATAGLRDRVSPKMIGERRDVFNALPQQTQRYVPSALQLLDFPLNGGSVPCCRHT